MGNKQQQLSRTALIKHSALAQRPAVYCILDRSRPDWAPTKKSGRCHDYRLPPRRERGRNQTALTVAHPCSRQPKSRRLGSTQSATATRSLRLERSHLRREDNWA
ncbi:hypothetical protein VZT92_004389 [Zoarces viviparus]|uniref:Uncharacterized protein n=1 Tax=Zoarces viviparus TaxID=48416 RepID=A0AAW1FY57_ZOAVI